PTFFPARFTSSAAPSTKGPRSSQLASACGPRPMVATWYPASRSRATSSSPINPLAPATTARRSLAMNPPLYFVDHQFLHAQHMLECPGTLHQLAHVRWHNLPTHPEFIGQPATGFGFGHCRQRVPDAVDLRLVGAGPFQGDSGSEAEVLR